MDSVPDIFKVSFERGNAMQPYWTFFITVSLGSVVFFGSGHRSTLIAGIFSIAFVGFAIVNCSALLQRSAERHVVHALARNAHAGTAWEDLVKVSEPPATRGLLFAHVIADLAVLSAIWVLTICRGPIAGP